MLVFLFTDIEGSSKLWEEHTSAMAGIIARHDEILRDQVEGCGGRITKHTGDGITAVFQTAGQPLDCALGAQVRFAAEPWGEIGELRIRAGLHAGEAEFHASAGTAEGDYFGPPVNATARVMSAAWGGQVLLTPEVTEVTPLPAGATLLDLGEHLLKNVSAPLKLYQLEHPQLPWHQFPPPCTLSGQSIGHAVDERGGQMAALEPQAMGVSLLVATLLPTLQGDLDPDAGALEGNLGVLEDLGARNLRGFVAGFAEQLRAGRPRPARDVQNLLERELMAQWQAEGDAAVALRSDASRLLQAVHGVEAAMTAATDEVKEALARGLADLGGQFSEFRWMLVGVRETLAEVRARQALQLALQREQLDLQRQQLVKTNLLLHRRREGPPLAELTVAGEVEDMAPAEVACPYKGLAAFEADDAEYFFGREELVAELTAHLAGTRFLAVVGPSGSGKSSLVRAGLLPAVWAGALPGSQDWQTLVITPGAHPLEELAVRVSLLRGIAPSSLHKALKTDSQALDLAVKQALAGEPEEVKLLLVVDQFEEIFALCRNATERGAFIEALLYAVEVEDGRAIVVPTVRADFYGRCADYPRLAARMSDGLLVGPMSQEELRQAIEGPAAVVGLGLEPGLAEMILDDVAGEPGALPLMSHALLETFGRRRGVELTLSGYAASGGVAGAIAQTADTVFDALDTKQQAVARSIFLRLTELGEEGSQDTRRRVAPAELIRSPEEAPEVEALLRTLADARLVTTGEDSVEVAHEALIREWPTLRGWLEEDREGLRVHRHLTGAAQEWERLGREPGELYRGARLAAAGEWGASHGEALNPLEREFLEAARELAEREEAEREAQRQRELEAARQLAEERRQAATRLRRRALWLAGAMGVAVILAVIAIIAFGQADRNADTAQAASTQAVSERYAAETAQALEADQRATAEAEGWARATQQAVAEEQRAVAEAEAEARATQQAVAEAEAEARATQQTIAETEAEARATQQAVAEEQARLATSWELASAAVNNIVEDPELSVLLALEALATKDTLEARNALHQALPDLRILSTLPAHGPVQGLAYSPDGTLLASAGTINRTAMVWDTASGELLHTVETDQEIWKVAFSPDGRLLATSGYTKTYLWDAASGELQYTLSGKHAGAGAWDLGAGDVAFSPDGSRLIVANMDGVPKVWVLASRTAVLALEGHTGTCKAADYSPDGRHLATGGDDTSVRVWDARTGEQLLSLEGHAEFIWDVAFDPEGARLLSVGDGGTLNIWDVTSGANLLNVSGETGGNLRAAAWFPDGSRVVTGGYDGTARIWDAMTGRKLLSLAGHASTVMSSAIHPDGDTLATGSLTLKTWDLGPSRELACFGEPGDSGAFAYRPDRGELATSGPNGTILLWDPSDGTLLRELTADQPYGWICLAYSPDGTRLASGSGAGVWGLWDLATGQASIYEAHHDVVARVEFSPDGTRLATSSFDGSVKIWDVAAWPSQGSAKPAVTYTGHIRPGATANWTFGAVFSPDGSRVASAGGHNMVRVWDPETGQEIMALAGAEDAAWMNCVAYSPDGRFVAGCEGKGTIRVWEANTGEVYRILPGHTAAPGGLSFSADSARLASAAMDALAKVWDLETGEEIATFYGNEGQLARIDITPDGTTVAVGSNGLVRIYTVDTEELVALARSRVTRSLTTEECQKYLHVDECPERP